MSVHKNMFAHALEQPESQNDYSKYTRRIWCVAAKNTTDLIQVEDFTGLMKACFHVA